MVILGHQLLPKYRGVNFIIILKSGHFWPNCILGMSTLEHFGKSRTFFDSYLGHSRSNEHIIRLINVRYNLKDFFKIVFFGKKLKFWQKWVFWNFSKWLNFDVRRVSAWSSDKMLYETAISCLQADWVAESVQLYL